MMKIRNMNDLRKHSKVVGDYFFDPGASRSLDTTSIEGVYRQPYGELNEGYVVTVNGSAVDPHAFVYMFQATETVLAWFPIGRHESLESAEAFLASMGAVR